MAKQSRATGNVPEEPYVVEIGKAAIAREGKDVTVVTLSLSVQHALEVAAELAREGIDVEVLDLRSLVPLDREAIAASVAKTGRLVVVDEDYQSFGLSGEIVATVAERGVALTSPPVRVAVPDVPIPYARELEYAVLPRQDRIREAIRKVMG